MTKRAPIIDSDLFADPFRQRAFVQQTEADLWDAWLFLEEFLEVDYHGMMPDAVSTAMAAARLAVEHAMSDGALGWRAQSRPPSENSFAARWVYWAVHKHGASLAEAIDAVCQDLPKPQRTAARASAISRAYYRFLNSRNIDHQALRAWDFGLGPDEFKSVEHELVRRLTTKRR